VSVFDRLGVLVYRYRWAVLAFWGALLLASAIFAPRLGGELKGGGFDGAGSEAERVQDIMVDEFGVSPATLTVVFDGDGLPARSEEFRAKEDRALRDLRKLDEVRYVTTYADTKDPRFISEDGEKSYAVVGFDISIEETQDLVGEVRKTVRHDELETYVTGAPAVYLDIQSASNEDIRRAEKYAFPLALVILIFAFGTLVAAGMPVVIGGVSVVTSLAALYFVAGSYDMSIFVLSIATMLGLGLGIDYALFAVSRFREELESYPVPEAVPRMVATAGRSIFFSGTAVLIGLSGLLFFPYMFMRSIGVAGVIVVFVSVTAALTLLPAALAVIGRRINALAIRRRSGAPGASFWGRSAEVVMRHPVLVILLVAAILGALLYPVTHMKIGIPEASVLPEKYESRAGDDILKRDFDYASLTPMEVVATVPEDPLGAEGLSAVKALGERIRATGDVTRVESIYTVGEEAAGEYAARVAEARKEAEARAERRVDELVAGQVREQTEQRTDAVVEQQLSQLEAASGAVPPGAEERIRAQAEPQVEREVRNAEGEIRAAVERRVAEELDRRIPKLPEGISAGGEATPEGVANFFKTPEARNSQEIRDAIDGYVAGNRALIQAVTGANPYTEEARAAVGDVREVDAPDGVSFLVGGLSAGQKDFISSVYGKAPYAAAFVLGVTYLVLLLTFRSVFIPLKAVVVNILSLTASFGAFLTFMLIILYPKFTNYLMSVFSPTFLPYVLLFFLEAFFLYTYYYGWGKFHPLVHLGLGLGLNIVGTAIMFIANAWLTFMMSPRGISDQGAVLSTWEAVTNFTWMPINVHRMIANVAFGGSVAAAYAAFKFLQAETDEERAHYDWMGYIGNFVAISAFLPLPFAGYWLAKEIYAFSQTLGLTMMGGAFSWLFIIQAVLIGNLFLAANYYLWLGMGRVEGAQPLQKVIKYLLIGIAVSFMVWATPRSIIATVSEVRAMGGGTHPVLGYLGVMSAKNTAVNILILTTFMSFLLYRRTGKIATVPWAKKGHAAQLVIFAATAIFVIFLGVYGYFVEATVRIGLSVPQVLSVLFAMAAITAIDIFLFRGASKTGEVRWGRIPAISQYVLIFIAVTFTWLMGLMGYVRSGLRQHWHVYGVIRDQSVDAFTPTLGFATKVVSVTVLLFFLLIGFVFWISSLHDRPDFDRGTRAS